MVYRVHRYAEGGKVVKDHLQEENPQEPSKPARIYRGRPGLGGAIKDLVEAVADFAAPKSIKHRKRKIDEAVDEASR